jgi:Uncharacterized bacitracin resistance protein
MTVFYAIILGLVQGIAEFLPISSSGHLAILENFLGISGLAAMDTSALFNVLLHLSTLVAVCVAYWEDVRGMAAEVGPLVRSFGRNGEEAGGDRPKRRLILMIIISTLPLVLVVPIHKQIEQLSTIPWFVGLALVLTGLLLYISDKMPRGEKNERNMTVLDAVIVGLCQAVATAPGISRSGSTITAGICRGFDRQFAVRFSFLMSLLSVLGAVLLTLMDVLKTGVDAALIPAYLIGMAVAGVTGYFSIKLLQKIVAKGRFGGFAYYCWAVGGLTILLSLILG